MACSECPRPQLSALRPHRFSHRSHLIAMGTCHSSNSSRIASYRVPDGDGQMETFASPPPSPPRSSPPPSPLCEPRPTSIHPTLRLLFLGVCDDHSYLRTLAGHSDVLSIIWRFVLDEWTRLRVLEEQERQRQYGMIVVACLAPSSPVRSSTVRLTQSQMQVSPI